MKSSRIVVRARTARVEQSPFEQAARSAAENRPISGALEGNVEITVDATLEA